MIFNKHQALFGSFTFPVTLRTFPTVYELGAEGEAKKIFHLRDYWGGNLISIGIEDNTVNNIWASRDTFSGIYRIETGVEELVEGD